MSHKNSIIPRLLALLLVLILAVCVVAGSGYAKYRGQVVMTGETSYTNRLAESFRLLEYVMVQDGTGAYSKSGQTSDEEQSYLLIPNTVIPQEPFLAITGKTAVPAVLYIEICGFDGVSYTPASSWTKLPELTGPRGGEVYVYQNGGVLTAQTSALTHIPVLEDGFHVGAAPSAGSIEMTGYLLQAEESYQAGQAAALFTDRIGTTG